MTDNRETLTFVPREAGYCQQCGTYQDELYLASLNAPDKTESMAVCRDCAMQIQASFDRYRMQAAPVPQQPDDGNASGGRSGASKSKTVYVAVIVVCILAIAAIVAIGYTQDGWFQKDAERERVPAVETRAGGDPATYYNTAPKADRSDAERNTATSADAAGAETPSRPVIEAARTASGSELGDSNVDASRTFKASNTIDGSAQTCWCVNTEETGGVGASIEYRLRRKTTVRGIRLLNGNLYRPDADLYSLNGQVRVFTVRFSDGTQISAAADYNSGDPQQWQTIRFEEPVTTDSLRLTVQSAYTGSLYTTNVCLTEIEVF